ncbi:MAG: hypothetical protein EBV15_10565, partial [Bacteroidetes bacterium]|nr:hypothetical protein [Bacteroidota bacterium]
MTPTEKHMTVTIENQTLDFAISGETYVGDATVLLHQDIDMLQGKPYHDVGFQIFDILNEAEF